MDGSGTMRGLSLPKIKETTMTIDGFAMLFLTAAASSAFTLLLGWLLYRQVLEKRLDRQLLEVQAEFERRVKQGVLAAGRELLPEFRREVAAGFADALRDSPASAVEGGIKVVAESASLLEKGLGSLFGLKPKA